MQFLDHLMLDILAMCARIHSHLKGLCCHIRLPSTARGSSNDMIPINKGYVKSVAHSSIHMLVSCVISPTAAVHGAGQRFATIQIGLTNSQMRMCLLLTRGIANRKCKLGSMGIRTFSQQSRLSRQMAKSLATCKGEPIHSVGRGAARA